MHKDSQCGSLFFVSIREKSHVIMNLIAISKRKGKIKKWDYSIFYWKKKENTTVVWVEEI